MYTFIFSKWMQFCALRAFFFIISHFFVYEKLTFSQNPGTLSISIYQYYSYGVFLVSNFDRHCN